MNVLHGLARLVDARAPWNRPAWLPIALAAVYVAALAVGLALR